jgi:hypothetical protein
MTAYAEQDNVWKIYYSGAYYNGSTEQMTFSLDGVGVLGLEYQSERASGPGRTIAIEHNVPGGRKYSYTLLTASPGEIALGSALAPATPQ